MAADIVVPRAGVSVGWNRYAYVADNPVRHLDPTGHAPYLIDLGPAGPPVPHPYVVRSLAERTAVLDALVDVVGDFSGIRAMRRFMRWEIESGRLDPAGTGSDWWAYVNGSIIADIEVAVRLTLQGDPTAESAGVQGWLDFIALATTAPAGQFAGGATPPTSLYELMSGGRSGLVLEAFWTAHQTSLHEGIREAPSILFEAEPTNEQAVIAAVIVNVDRSALVNVQYSGIPRFFMDRLVSGDYPDTYPGGSVGSWGCALGGGCPGDVGLTSTRWGP